jgi:hypothetical protein
MKRTLIPVIALAMILPACGSKKAAKTVVQPAATAPAHQASSQMPNDAMHQGMAGAMGTDSGHSMALNTKVSLPEAIRKAWTGVKIKVINTKTKKAEMFTVPIGSTKVLGNSGLKITVKSFVPDFVMGADGITSRSAESKNPAAQVVISDNGKPDFNGWLFAAMPNIHPYPHPLYRVVLAGGIPSR